MITSSYGLVAANLRLLKVKVTETTRGDNPPQPPNDEFWIGTPFSQIEPTMAYQYGLPLILIIEKGMVQEGVYGFGIGPFTILEWDSQVTKVDPIDTFL